MVYLRGICYCVYFYIYVVLLRKYNILNMKIDGLIIGDILYIYFKYVVLYDSDICIYVVDMNFKNVRCSLVVY